MRACNTCGAREGEGVDFRRDGRNQCMPCRRESRRRSRAANPEQAREYHRAWLARNPDYMKKWRDAHPGYFRPKTDAERAKRRQRTRTWRSENAELRREYDARYRERNPGKIAARQAVGRAVKSGALVLPQGCERCGEGGNLEGHHHSYARGRGSMWNGFASAAM